MAIEPYLTADMIKRLAKLPKAKQQLALIEIGKQEHARCAEDIFYWLDSSRHPIPYVYTKDPKAMHECNLCSDSEAYNFDKRQVHLLSRHKLEAHTDSDMRQYFKELDTIRQVKMLPYFKPIIEAWLREKMLAIEKSRDMMATWLVVIMYTWDSLYHRGRQNIFQSENSTKTRDLIDRAFTIWSNQPRWLRDVHKAQMSEGTNRSGKIIIPTLQSEIIGFPGGAQQIRSFHPSGIFSDEAAFNPNAGETFAAIKPAIGEGGRYTAISSANPSFFMRICRDVNI